MHNSNSKISAKFQYDLWLNEREVTREVILLISVALLRSITKYCTCTSYVLRTLKNSEGHTEEALGIKLRDKELNIKKLL